MWYSLVVNGRTNSEAFAYRTLLKWNLNQHFSNQALLFQLNRRKRTQPENRQELNGYIANSTVYVTSINENGAIESKPTISSPKAQPKSFQAKPAPVIANGIDKKKDIIKEEDKVEPEKHEVDKSEKIIVQCESEIVVDRDISDAYSVAREHLNNGRSEKLIGEQPDHRIRATAIVENNKLGPGENRWVVDHSCLDYGSCRRCHKMSLQKKIGIQVGIYRKKKL